MKSTLIIFVILVMLSNSCTDNVSLNNSDFNKYPWLMPFIIENNGISGTHNIDLGSMKFKYEYLCEYTCAKNYIDSIILADKWDIKLSTNNLRTVQKEIPIYNGVLEFVTMKIKLDSVHGVAYFEIP
jgi:hypothetical protein